MYAFFMQKNERNNKKMELVTKNPEEQKINCQRKYISGTLLRKLQEM